MMRVLTVLLLSPLCHGLVRTSQSIGTSTRPRATSLAAVSSKQPAALDGAEWVSVQECCGVSKFTPSGSMVIVTGSRLESSTSDRVVGIQAKEGIALSADTFLYPQSVAKIPPHVSDRDAISTLLVALAGVHCVLPRIEGVGGSDDEFVLGGKVVVMGGSDYACFCARGLAALGAQVHVVSTGSPNLPSPISTMGPATDDNDLGFSTVLGTFDVLLDTLSDEARLGEMPMVANRDLMASTGTGVLALLSQRHKCRRYISTMTASQRIIRDSGILFGPKQAQQHLEMMKPTPIVPPPRFGETVERLLSLGITYNVQYKGPTAVRTWNLPDFWELASWPRDSSGGSNVRFGLPVLDDLGLDLLQEELDRQEERDTAVSTPASEAANPYVTSIIGLEGLHQTIVAPQQDCLLFLSAPFCRTCRTLGPLYTRMARLQEESDIIFAKADTSGKLGKALSRALEVEAVPTFVLFRNGKRYGTALGVTRIPSKKLDLALQLLSSGEEWDSTAFRELEEQEEKTNKK